MWKYTRVCSLLNRKPGQTHAFRWTKFVANGVPGLRCRSFGDDVCFNAWCKSNEQLAYGEPNPKNVIPTVVCPCAFGAQRSVSWWSNAVSGYWNLNPTRIQICLNERSMSFVDCSVQKGSSNKSIYVRCWAYVADVCVRYNYHSTEVSDTFYDVAD